jgi:cation:H+ antiporter
MLTVLSEAWTADLPWVAIVVGLVLLVVGADLLVRGAVWIALTLGMSRMAVGLTLVAMGTSMPEMLVSLTAARSGHSAIAMANVLGSNVANVLLIVGIAAAIRGIRLRTDWLELAFMLLATALAAVPFLAAPSVDRPLAGGMVAMLALFCLLLLRRERTRLEHPGHEPAPRATPVGWLVHLGVLAVGLGLLVVGAEWLVDGSVVVARSLGVSDAIIGMTVVAVGTSLPELATSTVAAARGQPEIAVGNVLGSNIFNVGCVLGLSALVQPFGVDRAALGGLMVATAGSALLLAAVLRLQHGVNRRTGAVFLLVYAGYLAWEIRAAGGA